MIRYSLPILFLQELFIMFSSNGLWEIYLGDWLHVQDGREFTGVVGVSN